MDASLIVAGIALMVVLALAAGVLQAEERAWRDVARARRRNWEERQRTHELLGFDREVPELPVQVTAFRE